MFHWLHHLLNPHCPDCQLQRDEQEICDSCETLKVQLSIANIEKKQLLESLLSITKPEIHPEIRLNPEDAKPKLMTWNIRKRMLEEEDRRAASVIAERNKIKTSIDDLEKELGIVKEEENVSTIG